MLKIYEDLRHQLLAFSSNPNTADLHASYGKSIARVTQKIEELLRIQRESPNKD